ncbi:MAG: DUF2079 domain-containing protein [Armatimonadetes bacterium]|nr:DUF2079 domain-containing protein [Armatimonadota bacterium]
MKESNNKIFESKQLDPVEGNNVKNNVTVKAPDKAERAADLIVCTGILAYAVFYGFLSVRRVIRLEAGAFDLGIYDQAIWQIAHFQHLFSTVRGMNLFGDHFTPILFLLAPLYWFFPEPQGLVVFQAIALALGAWPIYRIARRHSVSPFLATGLALSYLMAPALAYPPLFDFHPNVLAAPLLLFAIDSVERENYRIFVVWITLALLCRQDIALSVAVLGLAIILRTFSIRGNNHYHDEPDLINDQRVARRRRARFIAGILTMLAGILWLMGSMYMITLVSGHVTGYVALYSHFGRTPLQIIENVTLHPIRTISYVSNPATADFILQLILPTAGLCLLCPEILMVTLPELAMDILSDRWIMQTIRAQYTPAILPFVYAAAAVGLGRLMAALHRFELVPQITESLAGLIFVLLVGFCFWSYGPRDIFHEIWSGYLTETVLQEREALLSKIPAAASVSAGWDFVVPLDHRNQIYMFPNPFIKAWYGPGTAVIRQEDLNYHPPLPTKLKPLLAKHPIDYIVATDSGQYKSLLKAAVKYGLYKIVSRKGKMIILKRSNQ